MSDFILLKWRAQQALNTSLSVGGVGACMHGCMSGAELLLAMVDLYTFQDNTAS